MKKESEKDFQAKPQKDDDLSGFGFLKLLKKEQKQGHLEQIIQVQWNLQKRYLLQIINNNQFAMNNKAQFSKQTLELAQQYAQQLTIKIQSLRNKMMKKYKQQKIEEDQQEEQLKSHYYSNRSQCCNEPDQRSPQVERLLLNELKKHLCIYYGYNSDLIVSFFIYAQTSRIGSILRCE
ncbi:unnamed protein product [Paramecium sonneborni]|uniref:Uncharacterized protein n=1 Tax=Paramecium sonneborni TaxID=65129 RepID=A0A8S1NDJ5_9CILI|nr:unnamed protein product [Paramecium sonneborni]